MKKSLGNVFVAVAVLLLVTLACSINFTDPPAAPVSEPVGPTAQEIEDVLVYNGFEEYSDSKCSEPCSAYINAAYPMVAIVSGDGRFVISVPATDSDSKNEEVVSILIDVLNTLYGRDVTRWCADHLPDSVFADQEGNKGDYHILIMFMPKEGNIIYSTFIIKITPR